MKYANSRECVLSRFPNFLQRHNNHHLFTFKSPQTMKKFLLFAALLSIVVLVGLHYYLEYKKTIPEVSASTEQSGDLSREMQMSEDYNISGTSSGAQEDRTMTHDDRCEYRMRESTPEAPTEIVETHAPSTPAPPENHGEELEEKVYQITDVMPTFPGGESALLKYIATNLKYPRSAREMEIQGVVVLRFVVKSDGSVGKVVVQKGLSPDCDKAAIDLIKSLPRFKPGKENGQPVNAWFTCPVRFVIS